MGKASRLLDSISFLSDGAPGDDEIIEVEVDLPLGNVFPAMIDVDPDLLDLETIDVPESEARPREGGDPVDPPSQDAVVSPGGVELAVHHDAIPAAVLK